MSTDLSIALFIHHHLSNPVFTQINVFFTHLGSTGIVWIILSILCLFFKKTRLTGISMLVSLLLALLVANGIKLLFNRPRPFQDYPLAISISPPGGSSFPSAHAATSFAPAVSYCTTVKEKPAAYLKIPLLLLALFTAFTRLYLFVHYPSDILAGSLIGILIGYFVPLGLQKLENRGRIKF